MLRYVRNHRRAVDHDLQMWFLLEVPKAMLTIFTAPKPFQGLIDVIQRNAIGSWKQLGSNVEIFLIGMEDGIAEAAEQLGVSHFPDVGKNDQGTPLVSSIFQIARDHSRYENLCFVNTDVIFIDDLLENVEHFSQEFERFLIVGQRWDLALNELIRFENGWVEEIRADLRNSGRLHPPAGSDYFVFPKSTFEQIPPLAIGRAGWDNWMIYHGRAEMIPVIDATSAITIIHQDHDYGHLPGGVPHYDLPESEQNVRLAGGRETVFTLNDANWMVSCGNLIRRGLRDVGIIRSIETAIVLAFGPGRVTRVLQSLLHPWETVKYYSAAFQRRLTRPKSGYK